MPSVRRFVEFLVDGGVLYFVNVAGLPKIVAVSGECCTDGGKAEVTCVFSRNVGPGPPGKVEILDQEMGIVATCATQVTVQISEQVGTGFKAVVEGGLAAIQVVPECPNQDRDVD
jgi:hypothetical protein